MPDKADAAIDALLAENASSSPGALFDHAANSGLFGFSDELVGGYKALAKKVLPEALGGMPAGTPIGDTYRHDRDEVRARLAEESAGHPAASLAGDVGGGLIAAFAPGGVAARGLTAGQRLLAAVRAGAAYGGAAGLGNSNADLTRGNVGGAALDAGVGAVAGGALAGSATMAGNAVAPAAAKLRDMAINQGRRFLSGTSGSLSNTAALTPEVVEEAFQQGAISPFSTVHTAAEKLQNLREDLGAVYHNLVGVLEANGVAGPEARAVGQQYATRAAAVDANTMNPAVTSVYTDAAGRVATRPTDAAGRLSLSQAEALKQSMQGTARSAYKQLQPDEVGDAYMTAASMMRQAVEDAIEKGATLNRSMRRNPVVQDSAAAFIPIKEQLSRIIPASDAASAAANRLERNHAVGLKEVILAAGDPVKLGGALLLKSRGASTAASALRAGANMMDALPAPPPLTFQAALAAALQRMPAASSRRSEDDSKEEAINRLLNGEP